MSEDELQVSHTDEAKQYLEQVLVTHAGRLVGWSAGRLADVQATGSGDDDDFFAAAEAFWTGFAVAEGTAGDSCVSIG